MCEIRPWMHSILFNVSNDMHKISRDDRPSMLPFKFGSHFEQEIFKIGLYMSRIKCAEFSRDYEFVSKICVRPLVFDIS